MKRGIDVSENNGFVDWESVAAAGVEFAIIRLGWGKRHLDSRFYENINGALNAGLKVGVYYYSYALTEEDAENEAEFVDGILEDAGLDDRIEMGIWFDMEDADSYKERHGVTGPQEITNLCNAYINSLWRAGYAYVGLYANLDWLTNKIYVDQLGGCAIWCAQYSDQCDYEDAHCWQYTDSARINGEMFDADIILK